MDEFNEGNFWDDKDKLKIVGRKIFSSTVTASTITIRGSSLFQDNVKAEKINTFGQCTIQGNTLAKTLQNAGTLKIKGLCEVQNISNTGSCNINTIAAEVLSSSGSFLVKESAKVKEFDVKGTVRLLGELISNKIHIRFGTFSEINEMEGQNITIQPVGRKNIIRSYFKVFNFKKIKGNQVRLEKTNGQLVIGHDVYIGPGCKINEIHYSGTLYVHPSAKVGKRVLIRL